jgi:hypothetical protein
MIAAPKTSLSDCANLQLSQIVHIYPKWSWLFLDAHRLPQTPKLTVLGVAGHSIYTRSLNGEPVVGYGANKTYGHWPI